MPSSITIHADPKADVATIADKIVRSAAHKIYLAVDNDARIAYHVLNFQLLRREAESSGKELVIVSSSIRVQALATKAGLQIQETRGGGMLADERPEETPEQNKFSAVRLGARRVADITPRHLHAADVVPPMRVELHGEKTMEEGRMQSQKAHKQEISHAHVKAPNEEPQEIGDILRREAQAQDSAWRKFLRTPKGFRRNAPQRTPQTEFAVAQSHARPPKTHRTHPRLKNPFLFFSSSAMRKRPIRFSFVWGSFIAAVGIIGIFVASTVLPTVTVALTPHTQKAMLQIPMHVQTALPQADDAHHLIPGQIIQDSVETSKTFTAQTQQDIETHATGQIRVFNQYSSAPQSLVQNTRFVSQDGLLFRTTQSVVVPGAQIQNGQIVPSSILVSVSAAEAGDKYNVGPSTFSIPGFQGTPKFTAFYGKSESAMAGGFSGTTTVVSDADIAQAKDDLNKSGVNDAQDKLRSHVPAGFVLLDDGIQQDPPVITFSAQSGGRATNFSGTIRYGVKALIFREDDIKNLIDAYIQNEYKGDPSMQALPQEDIHYTMAAKDFVNGKFDITLQADKTFASAIDTHTILTMVRGMSEANLRSYLASYPGVDQASVTFWPFWVHSVPDNQERISLKLQYPS